MAYLGLRFGRHSIQAALWNPNLGRAEEAHLPGLEVESASWEPVLAVRERDGTAEWTADAWDRLHEVSLAPYSLLERLGEGVQAFGRSGIDKDGPAVAGPGRLNA